MVSKLANIFNYSWYRLYASFYTILYVLIIHRNDCTEKAYTVMTLHRQFLYAFSVPSNNSDNNKIVEPVDSSTRLTFISYFYLRLTLCLKTDLKSSSRGVTVNVVVAYASPQEFLAITSTFPASMSRHLGMSKCHIPSYTSLCLLPCLFEWTNERLSQSFMKD